ncbi:MAG TPA: hypothetical protein VFF43_06445, partial [Caldimonas sp.]|nr:hypothetical protein [Caldimonas sp.]
WLALLASASLAIGPTVSRLTLPEAGGPRSPDPVHGDHVAMHHAAMHGHALAMADATAMASAAAHHDHLSAAQTPLQPPPAHSHTLEHCALCVVALFAFAVARPPPSVAMAATPPLPVALPRLRDIPRGRDTWSPIGSRGPPAVV